MSFKQLPIEAKVVILGAQGEWYNKFNTKNV